MWSVEVCSDQETVRDWKVKERFPGRSTGSYSILKVSRQRQGRPAVLADDDFQFQDSSKVNYSTIKVCGDGGGDYICFKPNFLSRRRQLLSTTQFSCSPRLCTSLISLRTSTSALWAVTGSTPGSTATASSTSWRWWGGAGYCLLGRLTWFVLFRLRWMDWREK